MSKVIRWKLKGFLPSVEGMCKAVMRPEVVMASDYDAAQAQLSALREELAGIKEGMAYRGSLFGKVQMQRDALLEELAESGKADHLRARIAFLTKEIHAMTDRLTAAEQRNADLSALVDRAYELEYIDGDWVDEYRRIKPTESGASE